MLRPPLNGVRAPSPLASVRGALVGATLIIAAWSVSACGDKIATAPPSVADSKVTVSSDALASASAAGDVSAAVAMGALVVGSNHTGSIVATGQVDSWTFNATQGDYLAVGLGELTGSATFTPWVRIVAPGGAVIVNSWNVSAALGAVAAPSTGSYTVLVGSADAGAVGTGTYNLTLAKGPGVPTISAGDEGGPMTNGATYEAHVFTGDLDQWTINATQGDYIAVGIGELNGSADFTPWIRLVAPNGAVIGNSWNAVAALIGVAAPSTGAYTIIVASADAGSDGNGDYSLTVAKGPGAMVTTPGDQGDSLSNGLTYAGTITTGDLDQWKFKATKGDYVAISMGEVTGSATFTPWVRVVAPNGALVVNSWNAKAALGAFAAPSTGEYTVILASADAGTVGTGDYSLTFAKGPGTMSTSAGDQGGTITNGPTYPGSITTGDLDQYKFSAKVGEYVAISMGEVTGSAAFTPWLRVVAPNGALVVNSWNAAAAMGAFAAPVTGTYTVILASADAGNDETGDYTLTFAKGPGAMTTTVGDQGGSVKNGATYNGTILTGDIDQFKFSAHKGDYLVVAVGEVTGSADFTPWVRLVAPNGALVGNAWNAAAAQVSVAAPLAGSYTVIIASADAGNDATGTYRLNIARAPSALTTTAGDQGGNITNGQIKSGAITVGDLDQYRIVAKKGEYLAVAMGETAGSADFEPWVRLVSPTGALVGNSWNVAAAQVGVITADSGTYTIILGTADAGLDATGNYNVTVAKAPGAFTTPAGDQGGALGNGVVRNGTTLIGDLDMWSFNSPLGTAITLTITKVSGDADYTPWIRLVSPTGAVWQSWGASGATINIVAPVAGIYTVIAGTADAGLDATGTYTITVTGVGITALMANGVEPLPLDDDIPDIADDSQKMTSN